MVRPEDVLGHARPTSTFLCPLSANSFGINFLSFVIEDYKTKKKIFEVSKDCPLPIEATRRDPSDPDSFRKINYELSEDFLRLPVVSTKLVFSVGDKPAKNLRMIERHYFRGKLVKSFDFEFGFCIPGSTNTWEACYDLPPMDSDLIESMVDRPYQTQSDSFYFVDDELIMHNKAYYKYIREDVNAQCKTYESKYSQPAKYGASSSRNAQDEKQQAKAPGKTPSSSDAPTHKGGVKELPLTNSSHTKAGGAKAESKDPWSKETDYI